MYLLRVAGLTQLLRYSSTVGVPKIATTRDSVNLDLDAAPFSVGSALEVRCF
jgi:hypothetical protein